MSNTPEPTATDSVVIAAYTDTIVLQNGDVVIDPERAHAFLEAERERSGK